MKRREIFIKEMSKLLKEIQENKQLEEMESSSKESQKNSNKWLEKMNKSLKVR